MKHSKGPLALGEKISLCGRLTLVRVLLPSLKALLNPSIIQFTIHRKKTWSGFLACGLTGTTIHSVSCLRTIPVTVGKMKSACRLDSLLVGHRSLDWILPCVRAGFSSHWMLTRVAARIMLNPSITLLTICRRVCKTK